MYENLTDTELIAILRVAQNEKDTKRVIEIITELERRGIVKPLKKLNEYTTEEKCTAFEVFYLRAQDHYNDNKRLGYSHDDSPHFIYEGVMNLLGENVWTNFNFFAM